MSSDQSVNNETQSQPQPQRITKVEKEKDPKRVAAGKKLAAYSKAARERKTQKRQTTPQESISDESEDVQTQPSHEDDYSVMTILTGIGVLTGLACLYYTYKQDKRSEEPKLIELSEVQPQIKLNIPQQQPNAPQSGNKLRSFD